MIHFVFLFVILVAKLNEIKNEEDTNSFFDSAVHMGM
ncbi:hypothetical protein SAMN05444280_104171 [Tangfeifania diversioriginum]|uniref:Uncharacterized protein n=1 Tax=Tangfeifania diversioriginum TaxID=1168035 RepID=A0A1M6D1V5_9BACT|nr:hypothetical protein SAMN05444280_104171 [Tangfeifania diversioriginum]